MNTSDTHTAEDNQAKLAQDCRVVEISSTYPILNRLVAQNVNVDELDCKQSSKKGQMGVRTKTWTKLRWRYPHV